MADQDSPSGASNMERAEGDRRAGADGADEGGSSGTTDNPKNLADGDKPVKPDGESGLSPTI